MAGFKLTNAWGAKATVATAEALLTTDTATGVDVRGENRLLVVIDQLTGWTSYDLTLMVFGGATSEKRWRKANNGIWTALTTSFAEWFDVAGWDRAHMLVTAFGGAGPGSVTRAQRLI